MRRQKKIDPLPIASRQLRIILNSTIQYHSNQDPISPPEKIALWEWEFHQELLDALDVIRAASFGVMNEKLDRVLFAVPEWNLAIRWQSQGSSPFLRIPKTGPYAIKLYQYGMANMRVITPEHISDVLSQQQTDKLREWAELACDLSVSLAEAKDTVNMIFAMVKTPGQLHRMVPELVQYLPDLTQELVSQQERRSKYPTGWAEFDKSRVERMLVELARGHLVKSSVGLAARDIHGDGFTWAQKLP